MSYSFANQDGSFVNQQGATPVLVLTPLTGTTVALTASQSQVFINPAGTIAAFTLLLPPSPAQGQTVSLSFGKIVTALTIKDSAAGAITGAPTAGAIGISTTLKYLGTSWVRWD